MGRGECRRATILNLGETKSSQLCPSTFVRGSSNAPKAVEGPVGRRKDRPLSVGFTSEFVDDLLQFVGGDVIVLLVRRKDLVGEIDLLQIRRESREDLREEEKLVEGRQGRQEGRRDEVDDTCA